jgi:hydroxypyruvate isomerase
MDKAMNREQWRMRYSAHLGLRAPDVPLFRHSARSASVADQIAYIADIGFAGVQDNFLKLRTPAEQAQIGTELARHNLQMASFTNNPLGWNKPLWGSRSAAARAELRNDIDASIAAAARVNGRIATCVTGYDAALVRADQFAAMIENLRVLADVAQQGGLVLCIEPVAENFIPGLLVNSVDDALAIVQAVDHAAVRLLFDFAHIQNHDGNVLDHLVHCWDWIGAIQVADAPGRIDLGAGTIDWPRALQILQQRGWRDLIEIEHMPLEETLAGEQQLLERLRSIEARMD